MSRNDFRELFREFGRILAGACRDLSPIVLVVVVFQLLVVRQPFSDLVTALVGLAMVVFGLAVLVIGLNTGLFPLGEALAQAFVRKGNLAWLLVFAFLLGFGTTVAEPALIAVVQEGARAAAEAGLIAPAPQALEDYALGVRVSVGLAVGLALVIGVLRTLRGWPLPYLVVGGYLLVMLMTMFAPSQIIGLAYDSGGVTTSTITVPLVTALGVGLARGIHGRDPLLDGFGFIALASLTPMIFVMFFGLIVHKGF
jgi:hypothetical protein